MEKKDKNIGDFGELPVSQGNPAFSPEELIACGRCRRKNPPDRLNCLYCGNELELAGRRAGEVKLNLRKLESWEKGFNIISGPAQNNLEPARIQKISQMLKLPAGLISAVLESGIGLPLARVATPVEAELVCQQLAQFDLETRIISDEQLGPDKPLRRLRGLEFSDEKIKFFLFNEVEKFEIPTEELTLIISGAIFEQRSDVSEKRLKKERESRIIESSETTSDESCLDIYSRSDPFGFRILTKGFDFSCLEAEKGLLAGQNLQRLTQKVREFAPHAKFVGDYFSVREILGAVWAVEHKKNSKGLQRGGIGKFNFGVVNTASNLDQLNKFSRLQRHLL